MKTFLIVALVLMTTTPALADDNVDQAKQEIYEVKASLDSALEQLPPDIGAYVFRTFREADRRLENVLSLLNQASSTTTQYCPVTVYVCNLPSTAHGSFNGKGYSKMEAKGEAEKACTEAGHWCRATDISCDSYTENHVCGR